MPSTIRDLTELTTVASDDYLLISDTSDVTNRDKRISVTNLQTNLARINVAQTWTALQTFNTGVNLGQTTLNYYEEGVWTPVVADAAPTGGNLASGNFQGRYIRIGNMVTVWATLLDIVKGSMVATNPVYVRGLPFPARTLTNFYTVGPVTTSRFTFTNYVGLRLTNGTSYLYFVQHVSSASVIEAAILVSDIGSPGSDAYFTVSYLV